jgi:hypothetical protein
VGCYLGLQSGKGRFIFQLNDQFSVIKAFQATVFFEDLNGFFGSTVTHPFIRRSNSVPVNSRSMVRSISLCLPFHPITAGRTRTGMTGSCIAAHRNHIFALNMVLVSCYKVLVCPRLFRTKGAG